MSIVQKTNIIFSTVLKNELKAVKSVLTYTRRLYWKIKTKKKNIREYKKRPTRTFNEFLIIKFIFSNIYFTIPDSEYFKITIYRLLSTFFFFQTIQKVSNENCRLLKLSVCSTSDCTTINKRNDGRRPLTELLMTAKRFNEHI